MKTTKIRLTNAEKGLLLGFASNLLSERTHNHIFNFMELESGLSRKYFLPPLLEIGGMLSEENVNCVNTGQVIDEIVLSDNDNDNDANFSGPAVSLSSLLACDDGDFFIMFRMKKSSLQTLEEVLSSFTLVSPMFQGVLPELPLQLKILMTMWILGNQEPYKEAAQMFNISVADCEACFISICSAFAENIAKYVSWPFPEEADMISSAIDVQYGFPGVIGIIGSASIKSTYSNQISKGGSCILQIVCDHKALIRDATVGPPGMDSVCGMFETSSLYKKLTSKKKPLITAFKHVIGGAQYPQLANLLTPYCGQNLSNDEVQFNTMHESVRKNVDRCFNALVTRFSRLQLVICTDVDHINTIVLATCFLHNFLLQHEDEIECM